MVKLFLFGLGILLLVKGADVLVDGASGLARKLGVSALMIGLTIVAFGTSLPEAVVNVLAALRGSPGIAFGNIIGSNMANTLLVLGVAAALRPLPVKRSTVRREIPFALLAVVVLLILTRGAAGKAALDRGKGLILICFFCVFLYYTAGMARRGRSSLLKEEPEAAPQRGVPMMSLRIAGGLVALYFGGRWTVDGAVALARALGLSNFLISATIIAVGTSLPELMTAIAASRRNDPDIAIGNSVGSNIFNIFWVLGITAVIAPVAVPASLGIDLLLLFAATFLLLASLFVGRRQVLKRWEGVLFLVLYGLYLVFLAVRG